MSGILAVIVGTSGGRLLTVGSGSGQYGYSSGAYGDLTPTEFLSSTIVLLVWDSANNTLSLMIANSSQPNSGWSTLNINGTTFLRTNASYSAGNWAWSGVSTNPIGTSGTIPVNIA